VLSLVVFTLVVGTAGRIDQLEEVQAKPSAGRPFGVEAQTWDWVSTEPRQAGSEEAVPRSPEAAGQQQAQAMLWASSVVVPACAPSAMQAEQVRRPRWLLEAAAAAAKRGVESPHEYQDASLVRTLRRCCTWISQP